MTNSSKKVIDIYKITVDEKVCIGCGACEAQCPENWELKDNVAKPKQTEIEELGCNKDAKEACPVEAIKIEKIE